MAIFDQNKKRHLNLIKQHLNPKNVSSLASKHEHALIGFQTGWHDWSSNIRSLADRNANFRAQNVHHQQICAKPGLPPSKVLRNEAMPNS